MGANICSATKTRENSQQSLSTKNMSLSNGTSIIKINLNKEETQIADKKIKIN